MAHQLYTMIMPKKKDIWKEIIKILHSTHGAKEIEAWFFGTTLCSLGPKEAIIQVPNRFVAIWHKDHFKTDLQDAFAALCGYRPQISYSYPTLANDPSSPEQLGYDSWSQLLHPPDPGYSFESFILDNSNKFAHAAALSVAQGHLIEPSYPLVIFSPLTTGKTHLLHAIGNRITQNNPQASVGYLNAKELIGIPQETLRPSSLERIENYILTLDVLLLDDIHSISANTAAQEILLSICKEFMANNRPIVFASSKSPWSMDQVDPDLVNRLQSGIVAEIPRVEEMTRMKIVRHKLAKHAIELTDDIIFYLSNLTHDLCELLSYCERIAKEASNYGRPVELSHIKRLLGRDKLNHVDIRSIQASVAHYYGLHPSQLRSHSRNRELCHCKHIAMYLCKQILGARLKEIGESFGKMNHSSVLYALRKIEKEIDNNRDLMEELEELKRIITYC